MHEKKILLLLANGFEAYEASVFTDVLGWNKMEGDGSTTVITCSIHPQISSTWNFTVLPEMALADVNVAEFDALAVPGGFEEAGFYLDAFHPDFLALIKKFNHAHKLIASICVGALPLGKSGILQNRQATTYHLNGGLRQKQLTTYGAIIVDKPIVIDDNIITSSSPATALSVAFALLEKLTSLPNSLAVKKLMGF